MANRAVGTKGFWAPEVRCGMFYNQKADMYSLGKTMATMHGPAGHYPSQAWRDLQYNLCNIDQSKRMSARRVRDAVAIQLLNFGGYRGQVQNHQAWVQRG